VIHLLETTIGVKMNTLSPYLIPSYLLYYIHLKTGCSRWCSCWCNSDDALGYVVRTAIVVGAAFGVATADVGRWKLVERHSGNSGVDRALEWTPLRCAPRLVELRRRWEVIPFLSHSFLELLLAIHQFLLSSSSNKLSVPWVLRCWPEWLIELLWRRLLVSPRLVVALLSVAGQVRVLVLGRGVARRRVVVVIGSSTDWDTALGSTANVSRCAVASQTSPVIAAEVATVRCAASGLVDTGVRRNHTTVGDPGRATGTYQTTTTDTRASVVVAALAGGSVVRAFSDQVRGNA